MGYLWIFAISIGFLAGFLKHQQLWALFIESVNQPGFTHKSGRPVTFCQTWAAEDRWNGEAIGMEASTWRIIPGLVSG